MHPFHYITVFTIISAASAQYLELRPVDLPAYQQPLPIREYVEREQNPKLTYALQLPRAEAPKIPFYNSEPTANLQPPRNNDQRTHLYYEYPEPSVELQAPTEGSWNPNNDPNLYYDNVPITIDFQTPTDLHPKKFDKDVYEKKYSTDPKKEVILQPITSDELGQLQKTVNKLSKLENQKNIRNEKTKQAVQI